MILALQERAQQVEGCQIEGYLVFLDSRDLIDELEIVGDLLDGTNSHYALGLHEECLKFLLFAQFSIGLECVFVGFPLIEKIAYPFVDCQVVRVELDEIFETAEPFLGISKQEITFRLLKMSLLKVGV